MIVKNEMGKASRKLTGAKGFWRSSFTLEWQKTPMLKTSSNVLIAGRPMG